MSIKPISISLSPNIEKDDILLSAKTILKPWIWKEGEEISKIENEFKNIFNIKYAFSFNGGRSSFLSILNSLDFKEEDEILIQSFTCNAVPNPIIWSKLKPIYVDCNKEDFNINTIDLENKITKRTKAVVVQHTFGMPADMDKIIDICNRYNLILIEDCAHSLGAKYKGKMVGSFGDVSFFSFSRDKIISSVYGGMVITNSDKIAKKIEEFKDNISFPSYYFIFQQLIHPLILNFLILPIYNFFNIGKIILIIFQNLNILSKAVHYKEKRGELPSYFPKKMPNGLAILALNQFKKIDKFNNHRKKISDFYYDNLKNNSFILPFKFKERDSVFLRFTVLSEKAHTIIRDAWNNNLLIGDWYTSSIAPIDTKRELMNYYKSCPNSEFLSKRSFNLPTHINISEKDAKKITSFLNDKYGN